MLVEKVQAIPGFEDFLKPKTFVNLSKAALHGPIVVINAHPHQCVALIHLDKIIYVPLYGMSYD